MNHRLILVRNLLMGMVLLSIAACALRTVGLLRFIIFPAQIPADSSYQIPVSRDLDGVALDTLSEQIEKRNIFILPTETVTERPKGIDQQAEGLSLIGLVSTGAAEAIVKDDSNGNTYFVKPGDRVRALSVAEVQQNYIILEWENEKKKLFIA